MTGQATFLAGVAEAFYGRPWTPSERRCLFAWMQQWGLNAYLYAPKDDLRHRLRWRELYDPTEAAALGAAVREAQSKGITFIYAIGPGWDLRYAETAELERLKRKCEQVLQLGCRDFAILFDDIPDGLSDADAQRFGTLAEAQCHVANEMLRFLRSRIDAGRLIFCPTEYCGIMAQPSVAESAYLRRVGERLDPEIDCFWTGPHVVSETISVASIHELKAVLNRAPVIWDNLHANDYDLRRLNLGPYAGRAPELRDEVKGILLNPNCDFAANFVPIRTLASFVNTDHTWRPRAAYLAALQEWLPAFGGQAAGPFSLGELELLGDCCYLPHEFGDRAGRLVADVKKLFGQAVEDWDDSYGRAVSICEQILHAFDRLCGIENRELLHALHRFYWELKEEAALLMGYLRWLKSKPAPGERFVSRNCQPHTYRGGLVATLQRWLPMDEQGRFSHRLPP